MENLIRLIMEITCMPLLWAAIGLAMILGGVYHKRSLRKEQVLLPFKDYGKEQNEESKSTDLTETNSTSVDTIWK